MCVSLPNSKFWNKRKGVLANEDIVPLFTAKVRRELKLEFPDCDLNDSDSLPDCIEKVFSVTGE